MGSMVWLGLAGLWFGVQPPTAISDNVLAEEAYVAVLDDESLFTAARSGELGTARAALLAAGELENPEIGWEREEAGPAEVETLWSVAWTPPVDGRRALRRDVARAGVGVEEERLRAALFALRLELRATYAEWALAKERLELLEAHAGEVERLAEIQRQRADAGETSGLAAKRLAIEAAKVRTEADRAAAELAGARAAALAWRGDLAPDVEPRRPALARAPASLGLGDRADLEARRRELERRRLEQRLSRRVFAAPELAAGWKRVSETGAGTIDGPVFGLSWSLPIARRGRPERVAASARASAAEASLVLAETRARAELEGALAVYRRLRRAALDPPPFEPSLIEAADLAYRLGESGLTDLLDVLRAGLDARLTRLELYRAALAAHRRLEAAAGRALIGEVGS